MDAFDDQPEFPDDVADDSADPAADFLAREQEELGDLGEELGIGGQQQVIPGVNIEGLSLEDREELDAVNREVAAQRTSTPSPAFVMPPRPKVRFYSHILLQKLAKK